jgi:hypothetical protein
MICASLAVIEVANFFGPYGSIIDSNGKVHTLRSSDDASQVLNNILASGGGVSIRGTLTCFSPIILAVGSDSLSSDGSGKLVFNNCDGLVIQANVVSVHDLMIEEAYYLRGHVGVSITGSNASPVGYENLYNLKIWGWSSALQLRYAVTSAFSNIDTSFSYNALVIHGQSVNNHFADSHFANFGVGTATVLIEHDDVNGAQPEGNTFVNCVVYGGTFGFELIYAAYTQVGSGCIVDGWQTTGVYALHCPDTQVASGAWVGSTSAVQPAIMLDSSVNSNIIGADIYVPHGSGVVLQGGSTGNTVSSHIVASVGIQEMSSADDFNIYTGNNLLVPAYGYGIIILGPHSTSGNNVWQTS